MEAGTVYRSIGAIPDSGAGGRGDWRRPVGHDERSRSDPGALDDVPREAPQDRIGRIVVWVLAGVAAALAVTAPVVGDLPAVLRSADPALWLIAGLAVVVDTRWFTGRQRFAAVDPSVAFTFALLLGWGIAVAVPAQALAVMVSSLRRRDPVWRLVYDQARYALSLAAAGDLVFSAAFDAWLRTAGCRLSWTPAP